MPPRRAAELRHVGMILLDSTRAGYPALLSEKWNSADRRASIRAMELPTRRQVPVSSDAGLATVECSRRISRGSSQRIAIAINARAIRRF